MSNTVYNVIGLRTITGGPETNATGAEKLAFQVYNQLIPPTHIPAPHTNRFSLTGKVSGIRGDAAACAGADDPVPQQLVAGEHAAAATAARGDGAAGRAARGGRQEGGATFTTQVRANCN